MTSRADSARLLSFRMLTEVVGKGAYSNLVSRADPSFLRMEPRDRKFAIALFYGVLTRSYTLDQYLSTCIRGSLAQLDVQVLVLLRMGAWQLLYSKNIPPFAAVNETVTLAREVTHSGSAGLVNAVLRKFADSMENGTIPSEKEKFDVRYSLNRELSGCFIKWFGREKAESVASAMLTSPALCARVNRLRTTPEKLTRILEAEGVDVKPGVFFPDALQLDLLGTPLSTLPSFQDGLFMIQDEAAMMAAYILNPMRGDRILDICSAPGGKACHLAELIGDDGRIIAADIKESRLALVEENQTRLLLRSIDTIVADATKLTPDSLPEGCPTRFDSVLADVPCSGLGLLRKKPEIRSTMTYAAIMELVEVQKTILAHAAEFVRPGGTLLYSTCTINPLENQGQMETFLANHPDFAPYPFPERVPEGLGLRASRHKTEANEGYMTLLPDDDACDGFFIARLRRETA